MDADPSAGGAAYCGEWVLSLSDTNHATEESTLTHLLPVNGGRRMCLETDGRGPAPLIAKSPAGLAVFDGLLHDRARLGEMLGLSKDRTVSDAELALAAYQQWGEESLLRLRGMFSLVIWDERRRLLLGSRDLVGFSPLFFADSGGRLMLSTSIEALLRQPAVSRAVNRAAVADHLLQRWPRREETFFDAVRRVPPGHVLRAGDAGCEMHRYRPFSFENVDWVREGELERFDERLDTAVQRALELGPAGIFLSGGLDSVGVAAVATEKSRNLGLPPPWSLCLSFPHPECNEEKTQRAVADRLGLRQAMLPLRDATGHENPLLATMELNARRPAPVLNCWHSCYLGLRTESLSHGCRVILTGGGGDEWLGVSAEYTADLLRSLDLRGLLRNLSCSIGSYKVPPVRAVLQQLWRYGGRPLLSAAGWQLVPQRMRARRLRLDRERIPSWLAPDPDLRKTLLERSEEALDGRREALRPRHHLGFYFREMPNSLEHPLVSMEMEEEYSAGRETGTRVVMPYWDADLIDLLWRVPPEALNAGGRSKGLIRHSVARRLPGLGFERQKKVISTMYFRSLVAEAAEPVWRRFAGNLSLGRLGIIDAPRFEGVIASLRTDKKMTQAATAWEVLNMDSWTRGRD